MRIGIDLDNTLINYTDAFIYGAHRFELIPKNWKGQKLELQEFIRSYSDGEHLWQSLQGKVYGHWIHKAKLFHGAYRFLWRCRQRGWTTIVVSHKTEHGHFDSERISLRDAAKDFLQSCNVWDPDGSGLLEELWFENTRAEKLQTIEKLGCDVFVDDLSEVLGNPAFPQTTRGILFDPTNQHKSTQMERALSWEELGSLILGELDVSELSALVESCGLPAVSEVERVPGGGNSRVYQVLTTSGKKFALKVYPSDPSHDRLRSEFEGLRLIHSKGDYPIPVSVGVDRYLEAATYEWVDGESVRNPKLEDAVQAVDFISCLHQLSKQAEFADFSKASAACLSGEEIEQQLDSRLELLMSEKDENLNSFLDKDFVSLLHKMLNRAKSLWPNHEFDSILEREHQTISPSDFGFHNALRIKNGALVFLDFEYFGWDDPVKLMCDFAFHQGMELSLSIRKYWFQKTLKLYGNDCLLSRLNALWPLYGLCWVLILLNEFRSDVWERRCGANPSTSNAHLDVKVQQLVRSRNLLKYIDHTVQSKAFDFN